MNHQLFEHATGAFGLVVDGENLIGVIWRGDLDGVRDELSRNYPTSQETSSQLLQQAWEQITAYLAGERTRFSLPFRIEGVSAFQKQVLQALCNCPYGATLTYGELAAQAGSPKAARAVGAAMAANPLPLVIPCHRVIGAGQKLTGFSGGHGIASKKSLLTMETEQTEHQE